MGNILNATKLDLSNQQLTEVPEFVFRCRNLKHLNLSQNQLVRIPAELGKLKYLRKLDVSDNRITQLLANTFNLESLEILNLNKNFIKSLPWQIGKLKKLKKLLISNNQLKLLPPEFKDLEALETLNISKNKFKVFPSQLIQLPSICELWVGQNEFNIMPVREIHERLINLKAFYAFTPATEGAYTDRNTTLLFKRKGNLINDLNLMTFNLGVSHSRETTNSLPIKDYKKIFISYSHTDEEFKNEVLKTLNGLKHIFKEIKTDVWSDDKIRSGSEWLKEIETAINTSDIAILIITRDFIASDFIMNKEVPSILKNAETRGAVVLNLIAGKSLISEELSKFHFVNPPDEPLKSLTDHQQDVIYTKLAEDVQFYLENPS